MTRRRGRRLRRDVSVQNPRRFRDIDRPGLEIWLATVLEDVAPDVGSFAVRLLNDDEIRQMNHTYRQKNRATDVLSFPGEAGPEGHHLGDVVISLPTARQQALKAGHTLQRELRELMLHGLLHCLGYDHETDDGAMQNEELRLRSRWIGEIS